jgi:hypothetical protein
MSACSTGVNAIVVENVYGNEWRNDMRKKCSGLPTSEAIGAQNLLQNEQKSMDQTSRLKEVFIPLKIDTKVGRRANIVRPSDYFTNTHLSRLLARVRILEDQLTNAETSYAQFCLQHKISQRYLRAIISLNCLSPKIKKTIMDGYVPGHLAIQDIINHRFSLIWQEQEEWFFNKNSDEV